MKGAKLSDGGQTAVAERLTNGLTAGWHAMQKQPCHPENLQKSITHTNTTNQQIFGLYQVRLNIGAYKVYSIDPGTVQLDDCIMAFSNQTTIMIRQQTSCRSWGL